MKKNKSDKLTPTELCMHLDAIQKVLDTPRNYELCQKDKTWRIVALHCRAGGWVSGILAQRAHDYCDFGTIVLRFGGHRETTLIDAGGSRTVSWYINNRLFKVIEDHVNAIGKHYLYTSRANARGREEIISPDMP